MVKGGVDIEETVLHLCLVLLPQQRPVQQIKVGASAGQGEQGLLLYGNTHRTLAGHDTDAKRAVRGIRHFVRNMHVQAASQSRRRGCLDGCFLQRHARIVRRIECGKDAQQVRHAIQGYTAYGELRVLVVISLDVQAGTELAVCLYTRQHLGIVYGV